MRVLVACEYSGRVRDAFRAKGHEAYSVDLLPSEADPEFHHIGDVLPIAHQVKVDGSNYWDLIIAHPPCTFLANSGAKHLYNGMRLENGVNQDRWAKMLEASAFFAALLKAKADKIAIENPIMHRWGKNAISEQWGNPVQPDQIIQPWWFGHGETKATCLWLKGLPKLVPTNIVEGREAKVHKMPPGPDRWKNRSRTYHGIAEAMAVQWG